MADRPRLLDLFSGAGGAAMGYHRAGFDVVGVDIRPQPNYPFEFVQADALEVLSDLLRERRLDRQLTHAELVAAPIQELEDRVSDFVLGAGVGVGGFYVQVDEDLAGHEAPSVGVAADSAKPAFRVKDFDAIHASPPCQAYTSLRVMHNARGDHPDLVGPTRELLQETGLPYVIENVPGAPIATVTRLCGSSFGLGVEAHDGWRQLRRHRYFETTFSFMSPPCQHSGPTIGLYGAHARDRRRVNGMAGRDFPDRDKLELGRKAMGMPWAQKWRELSEAIPPAYTEFIGHQLLAHVRPSVGAHT